MCSSSFIKFWWKTKKFHIEHKHIQRIVRPLRAGEFGLSNTIAELCILKTSIYCKNYLFIGWRIYQCDLCGKKMTSSNSLANHRKCVHEGTRNHTCETCGKSFAYPGDLRKHNATTHENETRIPWKRYNEIYFFFWGNKILLEINTNIIK